MPRNRYGRNYWLGAALILVVIVVMGLIVGFVAVALVSAMYGVFHQVKV